MSATFASRRAGDRSALIGVAVIGCGGMGAWHAGNLATQPGIDVVAVADVDETAAATVARSVGARIETGESLVHSDDVDAVLIASSDATHIDYAVPTIEAGKPCFLEKPIGATVEEARSVLDAEVDGGRILTRLGFMRELDPAHEQIAAAVSELGEITRVRSVHRNVDSALRSVDVIFAQSIVHDIHTIRWLTGAEFRRVTVHVASRRDGFRDVMLVGELSDGAIGVIDFEDQAFGYEVHVEVTAERGMAATLPHPRSVTRTDARESLAVGTGWFVRFEEAYRREIEEWCRCLRAGTVAGPTLWDGYAAQVVARAGEVAMQSGVPVDVDQPRRPDLYVHDR